MVRRLEAARSGVEAVCDWLVSPTPEVLDRCSGVLESAAAELANSMSWQGLARGDADALAEAWRLKRSVRRAARLLQNASDYHGRWSQTLGGKSEGYQPGGETAPVVHAGRIDLRG